jgi:hypothetical protein
MGIKVFNDRIEFGDYTISVSADGISLDTGIQANSFTVVPPMAGTVSGYIVGGNGRNNINKWPFSSDGNASDVGDLTTSRYGPAGQNSETNAYATAGKNPTLINTIDKFPFASDTNAVNIGSLATGGNYALAGNSSTTHGYKASGYNDPANYPPSYRPEIEKFPFATDTNASNVGNVTEQRFGISGASSTEHGYDMGGNLTSNVIDRFPFATDTNSSDVGDLTAQIYWQTGISGSTAGYTSAGFTPPGITNTTKIDKFDFASSANATTIGNLTAANQRGAGQNSETSGYTSGGSVNNIDKFPFATDTNASTVGNLVTSQSGPAGVQD